MSRIRLLRSTSFRLASIYLALFTLSALALGAFVYWSVRREILADFDDRIIEERDALKGVFDREGRARLAALLDACGSTGALAYGWQSADGKLLAGDLRAPTEKGGGPRLGWTDLQESDADDVAGEKPETIRALVSRLPDSSILLVGDERRRSNEALRRTVSAFAWAIAATLVLGATGGLWMSAQFLRRIDTMRLTAQAIMAGDWSRRIPLAPVDDDLSSLARTFNRLFTRIEKLMLANKHLSADIAHDLRKPLASVLRRLEAAGHSKASPEAAHADIETAKDEIESVLETFNALLRIGQIEAGARRAAFQPLDLADVAREAAEAFQPSAEDEGKALVVNLDEPLPIAGDRELLTQMMANLLDNALRHTPPGTRIEVCGKRAPSGILLTVSDNGPGVAPNELRTIFQRFYRGESARRMPGGGLGLSLVAAIAELHELECAAEDNRPGLRVTLSSAKERD